MIGKLKGIVDSVEESSLILDVGGVGYSVFCSGKTLGRIGEKGAAVSLIIETHVREDHIHLFGFAEKLELEWFRELTNVQGVGPKLAMSILSSLSPNEIIGALLAQDKTAFKGISGVGPKLSERLITELKGKVKNVSSESLAAVSSISKSVAVTSAISDALSALINLGYSRTEAYNAVVKAGKNEKLGVQDLIRESLKELAR